MKLHIDNIENLIENVYIVLSYITQTILRKAV